MPAWKEWRVESAIAWDWRKVRRAAKGSRPTEGHQLVPNLLQVREDGTGTSANEIRNQRLTHANSMSDKDCKVIGGSSEENRADKVHNKGVSGRAWGSNVHYRLIIATKEELLSGPLMTPKKTYQSNGVKFFHWIDRFWSTVGQGLAIQWPV